MTYYRGRRRSAPRPARWMDLHYAGTCHVCQKVLPAGARAFYDPDGRTVTCTDLECAGKDGLTEQKWWGAPTSGRFVEALADHRIGRKHGSDDPFARTIEDAPACGCCP